MENTNCSVTYSFSGFGRTYKNRSGKEGLPSFDLCKDYEYFLDTVPHSRSVT